MNRIIETQDGSHSVFSEQFGVSYHSKYGAIQETQHVFINAALRFKAVLSKRIDILEIGFGTGLNAYMTYLEGKKRNLQLTYTGVEAFPITSKQATTLNYPNLLQVEEEDKDIFKILHQSEWNTIVPLSSQFILTKCDQQFQHIDYTNAFDIIYFDAFAPNAQPELWELPIMQSMFQALRPGGLLVTYCAKGVVKRTLKAAGFEIEALKGPPGKREMTRATKPLIL